MIIGLALCIIPILVYVFGKCIERKYSSKQTSKVTPVDHEIAESKRSIEPNTARNANLDDLKNLEKLFKTINDSEFQLVKQCEILSQTRTIECPLSPPSVQKIDEREFNSKVLPKYFETEKKFKSLSRTQQLLHNLFSS